MEVGLMLFSCRYTSDGKIVELRKGILSEVRKISESRTIDRAGVEIPYAYGMVSKFPKELLDDDRPYVHRFLRISKVNDNGTVEIEYE